MTNRKTTRRALVLSLLSLLVCCSMLVGTTFAWFTDSVTSGNNTIVAGNLDIELEYSKTMEENSWKTVTNATELFTNTLWEPGHTDVVYLRLSNLGTLALKYRFSMNFAETEGTNVAGETFKLSQSLKYDIVDVTAAYADRDDARKAVEDSAETLATYEVSDEMKAGDPAKVMALVVYMPETVGNEANYKTSTAAPTINLGLNLFATQLEAEVDSFGSDYDKDAGLINVTVTNEAELVAALAKAKNGDVIGISGNVLWTTGAEVGSTPFVENAENPLTYITLKGVDENATFTAIGSGVDPVGIDGGTVVFKNLKIVDKSVSYAENSWEYGYLEFRGNTVFENCDVVNAIMVRGDSAAFKNCSFNSNKDGEYAVWVYNGDATFEDCTFTGARGVKVHEDHSSEVGTVVINNCVFNGLTQKPGVAIDTATADITIKNSTFINCQAGDQGLYIYETDNTVPTLENNQVINGAISGGRIGNAGTAEATRWQIAADFAATNVKTLAVNVKDANGNIITTVTPENYTIPADGNIGDPTEGSQYGWSTVCAVITGNSSSWQNTAFVPTVDAVPTTMELVINGVVVDSCAITYGVDLWEDVVDAAVERVSNAEDMRAAVVDGKTIIYIENGEYDMPNFDGGSVNGVKFIGQGSNTVIKLYNADNGTAGDYCLQGSTATFENVKIVTEIKDWAGFQNAQNLTFNKCEFENNLFLSGNATFNECHFVVTTNHYNVWAASAGNGNYTAEFNDCVFDCAGKSIYIDGNPDKTTTMKFDGCTFNDNDGGATDKAAIETGTTYGGGATYNVSITECEFNGFAAGMNTGSTIWANKNSIGSDKLNVTIDGADVY